MKINISNLPEGVKQYELTSSPSELGLEQPFFDTVFVSVSLEKNSSQLVLSAIIEAKGKFRCDRCLEEFETTLRPKLRSVYVWNETESSEMSEEDIHVLGRSDNVIDLSDDVKECLLLAIPLKVVCKEDCAGLCLSCGKNLNMMRFGQCDCRPKEIDPRWNRLGDIFESLRKN
jgi:uncharacterized protein